MSYISDTNDILYIKNVKFDSGEMRMQNKISEDKEAILIGHSESFSPKNRKDEQPCDPSLTLRMTGASEVKRTRSQEGRPVNEIKQKQITDNSLTSCHPTLYKNLPPCRGKWQRSCQRGYKKVAFTLTEVLLATIIVGVISAIVIPAIVTRYQEKNLQLAQKRVVQAVSNSVDTLVVNENTDFFKTYMYQDEAPESYDDYSGKFLKKYFKISKFCR